LIYHFENQKWYILYSTNLQPPNYDAIKVLARDTFVISIHRNSYFDGYTVKRLAHADEKYVLNEIYKTNNGKDMPSFS
jgi:hypothetical protein